MNEPESIIEAAASHPMVASTVAVSTTTGGFISVMMQAQSVLGFVSMAIGCVVGILVIRVYWIKYKLLKREYDQGE